MVTQLNVEKVTAAHRLLLQAGMLIAYPVIKNNGTLVIRIEGWNVMRAVPEVIDELHMPELGNGWITVHQIPVKVLNSAFRLDMDEVPEPDTYGYGKRFANGGMYRAEGDWNYPMYGDRIGALVNRLDRPNQMPKPIGHPRKVIEA